MKTNIIHKIILIIAIFIITACESTQQAITVTEKNQSLYKDEKNLWNYMANHMSMPIPDRPQIQERIDWYNNNDRYFKNISEKSNNILEYIIKRLDEEQMPLELALIPIVESSMNIKAKSKMKAAGIWQFRKQTAIYYGLTVNRSIDERYSFDRSTEAAISMLKDLYSKFGNWEHVLAAYNSGEGRVRRSIRKNREEGLPTDFWSISLPRETKKYVPKILALAHMIKSYKEFDLKLKRIERKTKTKKINVKTNISMNSLAKMYRNTSERKEFIRINSQYLKKNKSYYISKINIIDKNENIIKESIDKYKRSIRLDHYIVAKNDNLYSIAARFQTTVKAIKRENNLTNNKIYVNQRIRIPSTTKRHIVKKGDTLWSIGKRYNADLQDIVRWNNIKQRQSINIGQVIYIYR